MKFQCDKKTLQDALMVVSLAVSPKSTLPCLEGVLLCCVGQSLTLTGYNLELGIVKSIPISNAEAGEVVLGASIFLSIVTKMRGGTLEIQTDERGQTIVSDAGATFTILGLSPEDYPDLPTLSEGKQFSLEAGMLSEMIGGTLFAVAQIDQNPIYMGSLCTLTDGMFSMVSVDGYRLALRKQVVAGGGSLESVSFVVPGKTLGDLQKLLQKWNNTATDNTDTDDTDDTEAAGKVTISLSQKHITFSCMGYAVISRLIEGTFLDYEKTIPTEVQTTVLLNASDFLECLGRVSILINERAKSPVLCSLEQQEEGTGGEGTLTLSCETPMGKAIDHLRAGMQGESLRISFNNRYMQDAIKAAGCDQVRMTLNGAFAPIKITPTEPDDDSFLFLVLPVRS